MVYIPNLKYVEKIIGHILLTYWSVKRLTDTLSALWVYRFSASQLKLWSEILQYITTLVKVSPYKLLQRNGKSSKDNYTRENEEREDNPATNHMPRLMLFLEPRHHDREDVNMSETIFDYFLLHLIFLV